MDRLQDAVPRVGKFLVLFARPGQRVIVDYRGDVVCRPSPHEIHIRNGEGVAPVAFPPRSSLPDQAPSMPLPFRSYMQCPPLPSLVTRCLLECRPSKTVWGCSLMQRNLEAAFHQPCPPEQT